MPPIRRGSRSRSDAFDNVKQGIEVGLMFAGFGLLIGAGRVVVHVMKGRSFTDELDLTLLKNVGLYLASGAAAGAVVGLLLPLTERPFGKWIVGICAALVMGFGIGIMSHGDPRAWKEEVWGSTIIFGLLMGVLGTHAMTGK